MARKKRTGIAAQGSENRKRTHQVLLRLNDSEVKNLNSVVAKVGGSRQNTLRTLINKEKSG